MIKENVKRILTQLPSGVEVLAATKSVDANQIQEAITAGIRIIGENYVQEAQEKFKLIKEGVSWHFIGHLQKNKVNRAVEIFDMIQTVDSLELAQEIDKACKIKDKLMPVLIEINSAGEKQKFGVLPQEAEILIKEIARFENIKIQGLMTMGPFLENPEQLRYYFRQTRQVFQGLSSLNLPRVEMRYLSMGMSNSYDIAIAEGANLVRIGTSFFGQREP